MGILENTEVFFFLNPGNSKLAVVIQYISYHNKYELGPQFKIFNLY